MESDNLRVLTWVDDLMDTRLSCMLSHDIVKTIELVPLGYDVRDSDMFIWKGLGISRNRWKDIYGKRDTGILGKAVATAMTDFLRELVFSQNSQPINTPGKKIMELTVNTYPYRIPDDVLKEWGEVLKELIHPEIDVLWIRRRYDKLTPGHVMQKYNYLIHYDYDVWATAQKNTTEPASMVNLHVIGPRILKDEISEEDQEKYKEELSKFDLFKLTEMASVLTFQLALIDIDIWVAYKTNHGFSKDVMEVYGRIEAEPQ